MLTNVVWAGWSYGACCEGRDRGAVVRVLADAGPELYFVFTHDAMYDWF